MNQPKLLVLDEPTAGLDPRERIRFRKLIEQTAQSCIVLLSTHIVSDVEQTADTILIMKGGQLIFEKPQTEISEALEKLYMRMFEEKMG